MGIFAAFITRAFYYPSILWNASTNSIFGQTWYNRIDENIILGALPMRYMTKSLANENVKGIVSLNEDYELKYIYNSEKVWNDHGMQLLRLATPDLFASPTISQINTALNFIKKVKTETGGGTIYVHCKAGKTRSTTVVMCYLMKCKNMTQEDALELIKSKRPQVWLRKPQLECIKSFYSTQVEPLSNSVKDS